MIGELRNRALSKVKVIDWHSGYRRLFFRFEALEGDNRNPVKHTVLSPIFKGEPSEYVRDDFAQQVVEQLKKWNATSILDE